MIHTVIQTPRFDPDANEIVWETLVSLTVADGDVQIDGDGELLDLEMPVINLRDGGTVRFEDDPEEWVRFLPTAYRAGDLAAVVLEDDHPLPEGHITPLHEHVHHGVGA